MIFVFLFYLCCLPEGIYFGQHGTLEAMQPLAEAFRDAAGNRERRNSIVAEATKVAASYTDAADKANAGLEIYPSLYMRVSPGVAAVLPQAYCWDPFRWLCHCLYFTHVIVYRILCEVHGEGSHPERPVHCQRSEPADQGARRQAHVLQEAGVQGSYQYFEIHDDR